MFSLPSQSYEDFMLLGNFCFIAIANIGFAWILCCWGIFVLLLLQTSVFLLFSLFSLLFFFIIICINRVIKNMVTWKVMCC